MWFSLCCSLLMCTKNIASCLCPLFPFPCAVFSTKLCLPISSLCRRVKINLMFPLAIIFFLVFCYSFTEDSIFLISVVFSWLWCVVPLSTDICLSEHINLEDLSCLKILQFHTVLSIIPLCWLFAITLL